jgi:hypothetical protein
MVPEIAAPERPLLCDEEAGLEVVVVIPAEPGGISK